MPQVSVIVPVYNVETYLAACLDSIRNQSLTDIEIICVNDGSPDRSPALLRMAAAVEERIKVIDKPNGGLSSARNAGLRAATGDYVIFVDSDDFLESKACASIVKAFEKTGAEIVTFGANILPVSAGTRWLRRTLTPREVTYEGFDPAVLFDEKGSRPYVWRSAFSREFLIREQLEFDETVAFGEDQVFYFAAYPLSRRTALVKEWIYNYRVARPDSLMVSRFDNRKKMLADHQYIAEVICRLWRERGWLEDHRAPLFEWIVGFLGLDAVAKSGKFSRQLQNSLAAMLAEYFPAGPWLKDLNQLSRVLYDRFANPGGAIHGLLTRVLGVFWMFGREPVTTTVRIGNALWMSWPMLKVKGLLYRVLPASGRHQLMELRDIQDQVADDTQRNLALRLLHMEWIEKLNRERTGQRSERDELAG